VVPLNDLEAVAAALRARAHQFAAVIVEPVAANAGLIPPEPWFLQGLRDVTRSDGATLIFDEVIGGGLPVGAFGGRSELMDTLAPVGPVYQAGTLSGHPLAMAAGEALLTAATADVYERLESLGQQLEDGLRAAIEATGVEASVARVGSLLTVFFRAAPPRNLEQAEASDSAAFGRFHAALWDRGVFIPSSRFESWFISAAHTTEDIDAVVSAAHEAFAGTRS
jgi:glutamate-1-semialdehyde 2,1-aminomutase